MKKASIIFIVFYIGLLCLPCITIPLFENSPNTENRTLSDFPKFKDVDGKINKSFTAQLDLWLQEHIGFRNIMVSMNSMIMADIFGQSSVDSVVLGNDGWLFYSDTINDYLNIPTLTDRNVKNVAYSLSMVQDYVNAKGSEFVVAVVPNKNSLYPENMPYYYIPLEQKGNYELLVQALEAAGVQYADLMTPFREEKEVLYQKTDSHWNYKGALLGYNTILNSIDYEHEGFHTMTFESKRNWEADLAGMLYSEMAKLEVQLYCQYDFNYKITSHETSVEAITLETYNEKGEGNAVVYRDSFCNTMQVYFAENFENVLFSRQVPYNLSYVDSRSADVTVFEIVERNIINLAQKAPVMEAPKVIFSASANSVASDMVSMYTEEKGKYVHYYGTIDKELLGGEYCVYLLGIKDAGITAYEAFPIYEMELLENKEPGDNGYSVYIDSGEAAEFTQYAVVIKTDGKYYSCQK